MQDIDYRVMGQVFEVQNALGRLCDETIYGCALQSALRSQGIESAFEIPVKLTFSSFSKTLFIDLVVEQAVPYELKTVDRFSSKHQQQLLSYMMLTGATRGKLVNFRSPSVESKYVNTSLTRADRVAFSVVDNHWDGDKSFQSLVIELLRDWGTGLDSRLYAEAVAAHFFNSQRSIELHLDGVSMGRQRFNMIDDRTAFRFTSFKENLTPESRHLRLLAKAAGLDSIYWVNVSLKCVTFKTVRCVR